MAFEGSYLAAPVLLHGANAVDESHRRSTVIRVPSMVYTATSARMRVRVDCVGHSAARTASTHTRTRSTSRRAQIIQLGRARLERGRRPPAMQNGGYRVPLTRRAVTVGNEAPLAGLASKVPDGSDPSTLAWPSRCPAALRRRHRHPAAQRSWSRSLPGRHVPGRSNTSGSSMRWPLVEDRRFPSAGHPARSGRDETAEPARPPAAPA